jgi:hypothetical protein
VCAIGFCTRKYTLVHASTEFGDPDIDVIGLCADSVYCPRNRRIDPRSRPSSSYDAATPHMPLVTRDHIEYFVDRPFLNRTLFKLGAGKPDDQLALLKQLSSSPLKTR